MRAHEIINEDYGGSTHPYGRGIRRGDRVRLKNDAAGTVYTVTAVEGSTVLLDVGREVPESTVVPVNSTKKNTKRSMP